MIVLSLFDGMSCGQIALNRAGIPYKHYYASEIDPYAIKVTKANYPNTLHLGSIIGLDWFFEDVDLLIGGSPCQGFSFAGKQLAFDDPQSALFFEYVRLWRELQPKYWLLENVQMKKEHCDVISNILGVQPIKINSALVSAQNRVRLYWTNIPVNGLPEDKAIFLKDIIEKNVEEKYFLTPKALQGLKTIETRATKNNLGYRSGIVSVNEKANTIDASYYHGPDGKRTIIYGAAQRGRPLDENGKRKDYAGIKAIQRIEISGPKSNNLSTVQKDTLITDKNTFLRRLTPLECERLQTVPDNYTNHVSDTQRYKMLGNGWTVDVIAWIFSHLPEDYLIKKPGHE